MTAVHILEFIFIMIVLIVLHELGHMVVAKLCGMRVERFSVFFGRPLWSFRRGETEYGVGWLPLGGYVKITGMSREELFEREYDDEGRLLSETPVPPEVAARAYCNSTTPRKVATILAGPMANVVVAIAAFALSFWIGAPIFDRTDTLAAVQIGRPGAVAGLVKGDRIVSINGVSTAADGNVERMVAELENNPNRPVTIVYERDGARTTVTTPPLRPDEDDPTKGRLGVNFAPVKVGTQRDGPIDGVVNAFRETGYITKEQVVALGRLVAGSSEIRDQLSGPVGIGAVYNDAAEEGLGQKFRFAAIISLILAIMNLIPLLPLDGGHIVFAVAERLTGKRLSIAAFQRISIVGIALVLILAIYAFNNDISKIRGDGFGP